MESESGKEENERTNTGKDSVINPGLVIQIRYCWSTNKRLLTRRSEIKQTAQPS